jgi:mono/diheme cytochrome c family protein
MKIAHWTGLVLALAAAGAAWSQSMGGIMGQPGMMGQGMMGHGMMTGSMMRHHQAMMYGIPEPYRSAQNPLPNSAATLQLGAKVYAQNCAACHGPRGYGDGPAGQQLSPRPADLAWLAHSHMVGDQYIVWTVSEGGKPVGSAMPAFKGVLSQRDIWAVASYVRQGLESRPRY